MAIVLKSILKQMTLRKESFAKKHIIQDKLEVTKDHSGLKAELKTALGKLVKELDAANKDTTKDPIDTPLLALMFNEYLTKSSKGVKGVVNVFLTTEDQEELKNPLLEIEKILKNSKPTSLVALDLLYKGEKGGFHFFEAAKGMTKISILDYIKQLNDVTKAYKVRIVGVGKSPTRTRNAAAEIAEATGGEVKAYNAHAEALNTFYEENIQGKNAAEIKAVMMQFELQMKRLEILKRSAVQKCEDKVAEATESNNQKQLNTANQKKGEVETSYNGWLLKFTTAKGQAISSNDDQGVLIELKNKLLDLNAVVQNFQEGSYSLGDVKQKLTLLQKIKETESYNPIVTDKTNKLGKLFLVIKMRLKGLLPNVQELDADAMINDAKVKLLEIIANFKKDANAAVSFQLIDTVGGVVLNDDVSELLVALARQEAEMERVATIVGKDSSGVADKLRTMNTGVSQISTNAGNKLGALKTSTQSMADRETKVMEVVEDDSLGLTSKVKSIEKYHDELETFVTAFNDKLDAWMEEVAAG